MPPRVFSLSFNAAKHPLLMGTLRSLRGWHLFHRNSRTVQGSPGLGRFTLPALQRREYRHGTRQAGNEMHLASAECAGSCRCTSWYARRCMLAPRKCGWIIDGPRPRRACETRFQWAFLWFTALARPNWPLNAKFAARRAFRCEWPVSWFFIENGYIECTESFLDMPEVCWVHREWRLHEYVATLCHIKKINGVALIKDEIFLAIFFIFVISFMRVSTLLVFCNMIKIIHSKSLCSTCRTWSLLAN